jgi:hypothetical protein
MIGTMAGAAVYLVANNDTAAFACVALAFTTGLAIYEFRVTAIFWERSLSDKWSKKPQWL